MRHCVAYAAAFVLACVAVLGSSAQGEAPTATQATGVESSAATLQLGTAKEEVRALFGEPRLHYASEPGQYYTSEEYPVVARIYRAVSDVYTRKTTTNEYEIQVLYDADPRQSRLHPEERVYRVRFILDRPVPVLALLDDLVEAGLFAASACSLFGASDNLGDKILVVPEYPTPEQRELAAALATGWRPDETDGRWVPCLELELERNADSRSPGSLEVFVAPIDWLNVPVLEALLHVTDMDFQVHIAKRYGTLPGGYVGNIFRPLGRWSPEGSPYPHWRPLSPGGREVDRSATLDREAAAQTSGTSERGTVSGTLTYRSGRDKKPDMGARVWLLRSSVADSITSMTGKRGRDLLPQKWMVLGGDGTLTLGLVGGKNASYPYAREAIADGNGSFVLEGVPVGRWVVVLQSAHAKSVVPRDFLGKVICAPVKLEAGQVLDVTQDFGKTDY